MHVRMGLSLLPILIAAGVLIALGVSVLVLVVAILMRKTGGAPRGSSRSLPLKEAERAEAFRKRSEQFREEQKRILAMVAGGKISADEGDRLLGTLERETATMACPFCNEDIRIEAVKCRHCGSYLYQDISGPRRLTRSRNRMIAGVCGGLAHYLQLDPTLVRVLVALILLFSGIVAGLLIYLVAALIMPGPESAVA